MKTHAGLIPKLSAIIFPMVLSNITIAQWECGGVIFPVEQQALSCSRTEAAWNDTYRHQGTYIVGEPINSDLTKTIKIAIHVWQDSNGGNNYPEDESTVAMFAEAIAHLDGGMWTDNDQPSDPITGVAFIPDTKLRVDYQGVTFHQNSAMNSLLLSGPVDQLSNQAILDDPTGVMETCLLLHFVCPTCHYEYNGVPAPGIAGVASGTPDGSFGSNHYVVTKGGLNSVGGNTWVLAQHWAHEIGHNLNLCHTYGPQCGETCLATNLDFLSDVFDPPSNCWHQGFWGCDVWDSGNSCTNNMMGGTQHSGYYSPMQIGRMHRALATHGVRKYAWGYSEAPYLVSSDETWDFNIKFYSDIVVKQGTTLTIQCVVEMVPEAGIIVEPGARLVIDGGTVTAAQYSGTFWRGIEVWGSNAHNQSPSNHPTNQGMLVLKNGATIEHARNITVQQPGIYWTFGGVIQATDANFINCRRSAEFLAYQNTTSGGYPIGNRSFFRRCKFSVDENYRGGDDFYAHVSMWGVDGITFSACIFENRQNENALVVTESAKLGYGIVSEDASYRVLGLCTTNPPWVGDVCPEYDSTVFKGLDHGINARNFGSARNFIVSNCHFEDNVCGVYANHVVGFQVRNSRFLVGGNEVPVLNGDVDTEFNDRHRAVFSTESWAFAIDDNELVQSGTYAQTEGIVVGYSRDHNDVVFRNHATGLESAYIGEGISADITSGYTATRGLWFLCNENLGNSRNFWARKVTNDPGDQNDHTIRLNQGLPSRPADNTFDQLPGVDGQADFKLTTTHSPVAYWHRNTGNYVPEHFTQSTTGLFPAPATGIPSNNCAQKVLLIVTKDPSYPSGMAPGPVVQYLQEKKLAFGNTRYLYEQLIDDGNTDEVVLEIQESWPQDAWDLRAYLLSKSPNLSTEVLMNMVQRNILPTAMITEVLIANPAATRSDRFLTWLQGASGHPLPEYMLGMVVASWDVRGYRDALEAEMTLHHGEMSQAANLLIHHYHTLPLTEDDSTSVPMDSVLWVWQQVRTPAARYAEALTWMQLGNYAQASDVIASLPTEHKLRSPDELERQRMLDLIGFIANLRGSGRSEMQLDSSEVAFLKVLMGEAYDRPAALVGNLLCFGYGHCRAPLTGGDIDGDPKSLPYTPLTATGTGAQAELRIHPNPASTWVVIDYDLLVEPTDAAIIIRDMTGREVKRIVLRDRLQQVVWDSREVAPGTYTVVLQNKRQQLRTEKLIIRQ